MRSLRSLATLSAVLCTAVLFTTVAVAQSLSSITLTPFGYQAGIYAYCTDSNGNFVPYCTPSLGSGYYQYSGGHLHDDSSHLNQTSPPGPYVGTMTSNGQANTNTVNLKVSYSASRTGELEFMEACADTCNVTYVWVEFPFVQTQLPTSNNFVRIGSTSIHPNNHWGYQSTYDAIWSITNSYAAAYSRSGGYQLVGVNDVAIDFGGVFDICASGTCTQGYLPWRSPHTRHDYGKAVDFRANGGANSIVPAAYDEFIGWCRAYGLGSLAFLEAPGTSNQHIHCDGN